MSSFLGGDTQICAGPRPHQTDLPQKHERVGSRTVAYSTNTYQKPPPCQAQPGLKDMRCRKRPSHRDPHSGAWYGPQQAVPARRTFRWRSPRRALHNLVLLAHLPTLSSA